MRYRFEPFSHTRHCVQTCPVWLAQFLNVTRCLHPDDFYLHTLKLYVAGARLCSSCMYMLIRLAGIRNRRPLFRLLLISADKAEWKHLSVHSRLSNLRCVIVVVFFIHDLHTPHSQCTRFQHPSTAHGAKGSYGHLAFITQGVPR